MVSDPFVRSTSRAGWILVGAVSVAAIVGALAAWLWGSPRTPSWLEIRSAADSRRWEDLEAGLRRWLRAHPDDGKAHAMLGGLFFEQGRDGEALAALRRVKDPDQDWVHARTLMAEIAIRRCDFAEA